MQQMFNDAKQKAVHLVSENASTLLTAGGVVGTVATAVLTGRAAFLMGSALKADEIARLENLQPDRDEPEPMSKKDKILEFGPLFIPPVLVGGATLASIVMANRVSAQKAAALAAAYGLAERNLSEYKAKIAEKLTGPKKQAIDDELAQDAVDRTPGAGTVIIADGDTDVLCFDKPTGRYFKSSMQKIDRAVNAVNAEINRHNYATASHFYDELELDGTSWTDKVGWGIGEQIGLIKTTTLKDGRPVVVIDFEVMPSFDYDGTYR